MKKLSYADILPFIASGLVEERVHPLNLDVRLFDYTPDCQFGKHWNEVTMQCRGLVMNVKTGEILARPFPKFFNYDEYVGRGGVIPDEVPDISQKLDGSLGILYKLDGKYYITTRGRLDSRQGQWATEWFNTHVAHPEDAGEGLTHLFEIIYPDSKVVLDYDFTGLVHLGTHKIEDYSPVDFVWASPIRTPKKFEPTLLDMLNAEDKEGEEGYVVHFPASKLRLKIKFANYVSLHKIVTELSEIGIWELLQTKGIDVSSAEVVQNVPDELFAWVESVLTDLKSKYLAIESECRPIAEAAAALPTRKEQAEYITAHARLPGICFGMLDNSNYQKGIFKLIRPFGKTTFRDRDIKKTE